MKWGLENLGDSLRIKRVLQWISPPTAIEANIWKHVMGKEAAEMSTGDKD